MVALTKMNAWNDWHNMGTKKLYKSLDELHNPRFWSHVLPTKWRSYCDHIFCDVTSPYVNQSIGQFALTRFFPDSYQILWHFHVYQTSGPPNHDEVLIVSVAEQRMCLDDCQLQNWQQQRESIANIVNCITGLEINASDQFRCRRIIVTLLNKYQSITSLLEIEFLKRLKRYMLLHV